MTGLISWCADRARMMMFLLVISIAAGLLAYKNLPKEGAPDIDIPVLFVSVALPGISAVDGERLLVKPLETELRGVDGLSQMTNYAAEGHAGFFLEFDFGWDAVATLAEVRAKVDKAQAELPDEAEEPFIQEINLSEMPILVVSLSGAVPERTLSRLAKDLRRELEADDRILEADLTGQRDEMLEVLIDPLKLESYGITAAELLAVVDRNNQLVAAGAVESETAAFSVSVSGAFEDAADVYNLPIKTNGDRIVRLRDVAEIRRTFDDREGVARYNGRTTIALQVSKRLGENIIETVQVARAIVDAEVARWPAELQQAVQVDFSMDESRQVQGMVDQLEGAVGTAILLVMIVVLATLGFRSALLVGISIPSSFLLSFALMQALDMTVSNMVMFGLILAVGMLVDGAIVVVEYADKRMAAGQGPMRAYTAAAKRMFWPIVASTATTLCAFLPMLLWPGMPGEFMRNLPITLIFVLTASLLVALIFLPVLGGITGRITRALGRVAPVLRQAPTPPSSYKRTSFGKLVALIVTNPLGPFLAIGAAIGVMASVVFAFQAVGKGVEFFVDTLPERVVVHVRARGNLSVAEADRLVQLVEGRLAGIDGITSVFAFGGEGGLASGGFDSPPDAIGKIQLEFAPWYEGRSGHEILADVRAQAADLPGIFTEVSKIEGGPQQGKPIQLELTGTSWDDLNRAAEIARTRFDTTAGMIDVDDTRPLPGIEWQITVDRAAAGRFGADVATVGPMVQLVTRGALLGSYRPDDSDEEVEIRVRFPEQYRTLATLDGLKIPTAQGAVPLSNFITREPVAKIAEIQRRDGQRYFAVRADVQPDSGKTDVQLINELETWITEENPFPAGIGWAFGGDREEQEESQAFLMQAFAAALGLMFVILLAQFNSTYNALLVLTAVVMSATGVLVGMLVMDQKFSIIMTGTGIVALAGIVVNNNIVLIDTYQELARRMAPLEAVVRTAEARIRPVLLTTITTMAGLTPMMFAASLDFDRGMLSMGAPTAFWWIQLATAVVFGLGTATILTLLVTPSALAARIWVTAGGWAVWRQVIAGMARGTYRRQLLDDALLDDAFRKAAPEDFIFEDKQVRRPTLQAAE
ncbi:MAG: efflux RND transporter permease subunit [Pseudomonadota bacterium]